MSGYLELAFVDLNERQECAERRKAAITFCIKSWTRTLSFPQQNLPFVKRLLAAVMERFGAYIEKRVFTAVVEVNEANELMEILSGALARIMEVETAI